MATGALISGARAYSSAVRHMPYSQSAFARAIADTSRFRYSAFGAATLIREIVGETAGTYDACNGFNAPCISLTSWSEFKAEYDREISFRVDWKEEMNNILNGMTLTSTEKMKASWRMLGAEIDAVSCAKIFNKTPSGNQHANTEDGYKVDADNIIATLISMDNRLFNEGVNGDVAVMLSTKAYANLSNAIKNANGLASGVMLSPVKRKVDFWFEGEATPAEEEGLHFIYNIFKFQSRMYIYPVPDRSMISDVVLLDKKSAGQTAGGWIPDADAKAVDMLVVPMAAAALSVRHIVSSMTIPLNAYRVDTFDVNKELVGLNNMYGGQVYVENIGIDQSGDMYKYMNRIMYGVAVFKTWAHTIFAVYNETALTPSVTSVTVDPATIDSHGGGVTVAVAGSDLPNVVAGLFTSDGNSGSPTYTPVGDPVMLNGSKSNQYGIIGIPANVTAADISYFVRVSTDGGKTWDTKNAAVKSLKG